MKEHKHVAIKIEDGYVQLHLSDRSDLIELDERGLPLFPESVKQQVPPYIAEMVEKMVRKMRTDHASWAYLYLLIEHEDWCTKYTPQIRVCTCDPVFCEPKIEQYNRGEYKTLTCTVCGESSTGKVSFSIEDCWDELWVCKDGQRISTFWRFDDYDLGRLICDDCSSRIMQELRGGLNIPTLSETDNDQKANK